jgi:hypothetical protein
MQPFILMNVASKININPGTVIIMSRFFGKNFPKKKYYHVLVSRHGIWIGNWLYLMLVARNCKSL